MAQRISPTKLTLAYLRKRGIPARVTERWVKTATGGFRLDLFGGDLMALLGLEIVNIQAGTGAHHAAKIAKAIAHPDVRLWLLSPTRLFQIWTWSKRVARNKDGSKAKLPRWTPRVTSIAMQNGNLVASNFTLTT